MGEGKLKLFLWTLLALSNASLMLVDHAALRSVQALLTMSRIFPFPSLFYVRLHSVLIWRRLKTWMETMES
jgi:hypothetical protein